MGRQNPITIRRTLRKPPDLIRRRGFAIHMLQEVRPIETRGAQRVLAVERGHAMRDHLVAGTGGQHPGGGADGFGPLAAPGVDAALARVVVVAELAGGVVVRAVLVEVARRRGGHLVELVCHGPGHGREVPEHEDEGFGVRSGCCGRGWGLRRAGDL